MATGYTSGVQSGEITELKDYILRCSRNFGALVHMRDDNINIDIKHREINDYYLRKLNETNEEFEKFKKLSDDEIQEIIDKDYEERLKRREENLRNFAEGKQRYLDMLEKVEAWKSPTREHNKLKVFAMEQLSDSLAFDYGDNVKEIYLKEPVKFKIEEYRECSIKGFLKDIEYYSKQYREEIERVSKINKWIDDLINSFE